MKFGVFGATGGTGRAFCRLALDRDHQIVAFVRNASRNEIEHRNLTVVEGDVFDGQAVRGALEGVDAVLITFGVKGRMIKLYSRGTGNILQAMRAQAVSRISVVSETVYDHHTKNFNVGARILINVFRGFNYWVYRERRLQDQLLFDSNVDWTIYRPRGMFGKPKEDAPEQALCSLEPFSKMLRDIPSYTQLAALILEHFEHPDGWLRKEVYT
jgi:uncharacterized protein YbjT (DUF2867 family)